MNESQLNSFGLGIIEKVKRERIERFGQPLEFSIFYSPLHYQPELMIIGDNPGGAINEPGLDYIPKSHEYTDPNQTYPMALAFRNKIMKGERLGNILAGSVKLNRIFFRTKDLKSFNLLSMASEMEHYCRGILDEIIDTIKPKRILAESFGTFSALSNTYTSVLDKPNTKKSLLLIGKYNGIELLGINHPSQAWRQKITDDDWELVNNELEKRIV